MDNKNNKDNFVDFLVYPLTFLILGGIVFYLILGPILKPILDFSDIMVLTKTPEFEKNIEDIFNDVKEIPDTNEFILLDKNQIPREGQKFGNISINSAKINAPIIFGDGEKELMNGVGCSQQAYLPGSGRTVLMTAHNALHFYNLGNAREGDKIEITTNYGKYVYEVTGYKIGLNTDTDLFDMNKKEENLVLYTCYPFDGIGVTSERYFLYANYVSGPRLAFVY